MPAGWSLPTVANGRPPTAGISLSARTSPARRRAASQRSQSPIISLAISSDGRRLASGDYSGEIIVRDASDGRVLRQFHKLVRKRWPCRATAAWCLPECTTAALFVWDTNKGDLLGTRAFGDGINSMSLSPDGTAVALALGVRDGVVRVWEPGTGRFRGDLRGHHDEVLRVVWSHDGKSLLTASRDQTACLWSNTGGLAADLPRASGRRRGRRLLARWAEGRIASDDQSAILWNVDGGQACDTLTDTPVDGWVSGLAFTPDGNQVIGTGSCDGAGDSYEAYLTAWNLADGNGPNRCRHRRGRAWHWPFRPTAGRWSVGESSPPQSTVKSRARIWSLDPARVLATVPKLVGSVYSVAYSNDGRYAGGGHGRHGGAGAGLGAARRAVHRARCGRNCPNCPARSRRCSAPTAATCITVNSSREAAGGNSCLEPGRRRSWSEQISNPAELAGLTTTALSPDGRYLLTGHGDPANPNAADKAKIKVWDLTTRQLVGQFPAAHPAAITRTRVLPPRRDHGLRRHGGKCPHMGFCLATS